jgi:hypothetical protein
MLCDPLNTALLSRIPYLLGNVGVSSALNSRRKYKQNIAERKHNSFISLNVIPTTTSVLTC